MNFWGALFANVGGNDLAEINLQSRVDLTPLRMRIVFDMDNTLVDEFGSGIRPGVKRVDTGYSMVDW